MADDWKTFLGAQGAQWDEEGVCGFADTSPEAGSNQLAALDHLGYLAVEGPEARKFLQGQVTCDMNLVTEDHSQPGGHCNSKGRMIFSFRALQLPSESSDSELIALIMHRGLLENARQALAKFIVFSKAEVSIGDAYRLVGLCGTQAPRLLNPVLPRIPIASHDVAAAADAVCVRISGDRFLCLLRDESALQQWQNWAPHCQLQGYDYWNLTEIRDGLGHVVPGCQEMFIPQTLNMHITGGISFTKGCYIGQEVVARMHYLGKLKRHMRRAQVNAGEAPKPGASLYSQESQQSVGNVVLAAPSHTSTFELLAVTSDSAFESDALYLDPQQSQKVHGLPLPYAITK